MPRIRKDKMARSYAEPFWKIGLYIRLSREDDNEDEPTPEVDDDTGEVEARPLDDYLLDEDEPKKEDEE